MKKNSVEKKISVNLSLLIFILYSFFILINDYFTFLTNLNYTTSLILSLMVVSITYYCFRKKIKVIKNISKYDFIFCLLLFLFFIISIVYPDRTFDTFNYHLYLQEKPFGDKIFSDFFAAKNINSFTYAFTDRFSYLFRFFLGYRLGVLFNYFIIITIYFQSKKILKSLIKCNEIFLCLLSIMSTLTLSTVELLDSYYIDNISVVYLSELFYLTFIEKNKYYELELPFIGLLYGFTFVSKISNAFIIIVLFFFYIIYNKDFVKKLNIKLIIKTIIFFLFPFFVYMFYTYIKTGNPVFPYYNSFFHSPFFINENWLDKRFGPNNIIEVLIWPILMQIHPERSYDIAIVELMWAIGYISALLLLLKSIFNRLIYKTNDKNAIIYIFTLVCYLIWAKFMLGYTRYGLSVLFFGIINLCLFLNYLFKNKKIILIVLSLFILFINYYLSLSHFIKDAHFWTFNNFFSAENENISYKENFKLLLKDKNENIKLKDNSNVLIGYYNAGFVTLLTKNTNKISLTSGVSNKKTQKIFNKNLAKNKKIYTIVDAVDLENLITELNNNNYHIKNVEKVFNSNLVLNNNFSYLFELEKNNEKNKFFEISERYYFDLDEGNYNITFYSGLGKNMRNIDFKNYTIELCKTNGSKIDIINQYNIKQHNGSMKKFENNINLNKNEKIFIRINNEKGEEQDLLAIMILNLKIKKNNVE